MSKQSGRSGKAYADWISQRSSEFRDGIEWAALDPFGGYANALDAATSAARTAPLSEQAALQTRS